MSRCDCCGKFRKSSDCVTQEHCNSDNFVLDVWTECRFCMSKVERERFFKTHPEPGKLQDGNIGTVINYGTKNKKEG